MTRRVDSGGTKDGKEPGLYGGTRKAAACDKDQLVKFLQANPAKAAAWASALKIESATIPSFVGALTPAFLRVDTFVTNHGYRDGRATAMPAVLQAGIGVLVNSHGKPVVKCNCGNPLTDPDKKINVQKSKFNGAQWPQFKKEKVTVIEPHGEEVKTLELVDSDLGMVFDRPVGTEGDDDGKPEPVPTAAMPEPDPTKDPAKQPHFLKATEGPGTAKPTTGAPTGPPTKAPQSAESPKGVLPTAEPEQEEPSKEPVKDDPPPQEPSEEPSEEQPSKEPPAAQEESAPPQGEEKPPVAEPEPSSTP